MIQVVLFCFSDDHVHCLETSYAQSGPEQILMWQERTQRAALMDQNLQDSPVPHDYLNSQNCYEVLLLGKISNSCQSDPTIGPFVLSHLKY